MSERLKCQQAVLPEGAGHASFTVLFAVFRTETRCTDARRPHADTAIPSTTLQCTRCDRRWCSRPAGYALALDLNPGSLDFPSQAHLLGRQRFLTWRFTLCLVTHELTVRTQDQSLRLWNIKTRVVAAVMNGEGGHCNEVLSIVRTLPSQNTGKPAVQRGTCTQLPS